MADNREMRKPRRPFRPPEAAALSALEQKYEAIGKRWFEVPNPPLTLYHYCREDVLEKILGTGKLWASDVFCMNDKHEITYALSDVVGHIVSEMDVDGQPKYCFKSVKSPEIIKQLWGMVCTHIACFSATSEIASQWADYAKYTGYAIGFDQRALKHWCLQHGISLFPMIYQRPQQEQMIREFLDGERNIELAGAPSECIARKKLREQAMVYLSGLAMSLKEEKEWGKEQEWRILVIQQKDNGPGFERLTRDDGVCYFELPICTPEIVTEVVLGPSCSSDAEDRKRWLTEIGLSSVSVRRSLCQCPETHA